MSRLWGCAALAALVVACGRSGLPTRDDDRSVADGGTGAQVGSRAAGGGGGSGTGGTGLGGAAVGSGGSSAGAFGGAGASRGGGAGAPDFDFTLERDQAVAYQIDPMHSGAQLATKLEPPLRALWAKQFSAGVSYPVMADSRLFVSVNPGPDQPGPAVLAFDAASGNALWTSEPIKDDPTFSPVHLTYDRGGLFAVNERGSVVAFDAASGGVRWRTALTEIYGFGSMPVAAGGALFLAGATTESPSRSLFVLDERDGHLVYRGNAQGIGHPTLGGGLLFTSGGCYETEAADPRTGTMVWHHRENCFGGGGKRSMFHEGRLWVSERGHVALDAATGTRVAEINGFWALSAAGDEVVLPSIELGNHALLAFDALTGSPRWDVALPAEPVLPALVTPGYAFVLGGTQFRDKHLCAVSLATHEVVWQTREPTAPADVPWTGTGLEPYQAIAAAQGRLAVAFGRSLTVYTSATNVEPPPSLCGDFAVEGNERCDDGNVVDGDYCSADCSAETGSCGDGIIQDNESCDDDGPSCSDTCQTAFPNVMLAAGNHHTCGLRADGSVRCWGAGWVAAGVPVGTMSYIAAHANVAAGVMTDSTAAFWGVWISEPPAAASYSKLEPGRDSYCAIRQDRTLDCWKVPPPIPAGEFAALSAFDGRYCALTEGGRLSCFGERAVLPWGAIYRDVAVGGTATCVVRQDRSLECSDNLVPPLGEFAQVTAGYDFQCGIRTNGEVACWGRLDGRGGDANTLHPPSGKFALIDAGWQHVCGVRVEGHTVCWGANEARQATPPDDFP